MKNETYARSTMGNSNPLYLRLLLKYIDFMNIESDFCNL